ncbi:MAG: hypothetical protein IJL10_02220 [Synergistaceae bacterium]|nr:hypothetical protein [Synergistaceae bacterium]
MKRIIAGLLFAAAVYVSSLSTASAASSRTAGNAQEFQEALDSGAAEITITSSSGPSSERSVITRLLGDTTPRATFM